MYNNQQENIYWIKMIYDFLKMKNETQMCSNSNTCIIC